MEIAFPSLLYLIAVYIVFQLIRKDLRGPFLLLAGILYVYLLSPLAAVSAVVAASLSYLLGLAIGLCREKNHPVLARTLCGIGVLNVVLFLFFMKKGSLPMLIGSSYYGFQIISYLADLAGGKWKAVRNPWKLMLYMIWFPRFISGPIDRAGDFISQLDQLDQVPIFYIPRWTQSMLYICTGAFMKLMIADRLAPWAAAAFDEGSTDSLLLILGSLDYTFQIYHDFAGYSLIAYGISNLFGLQISQNFSLPYLAPDITEFWRRWHMSLSSWLRDYIYIPLGGNRKGFVRKMINLMIVFVICALWHGIGLQFLIWGLLHGLFSIVNQLLHARKIFFLTTGAVGRLLTFFSVSFAWIFFRASSAENAFFVIRNMFLGQHTTAGFLTMRYNSPMDFNILLLSLAAMTLLEILAWRKNQNVPQMLLKLPIPIKCLYIYITIVCIVIFGIYGADGVSTLYMAF